MENATLFEQEEERSAVVSEDGLYRYLLRRAWDHDRMRALFIMLNPSTADADVDDPTIRSCRRLCKSWGYGSFEVVNLYGWRATDPDDLNKARLCPLTDEVGPENDRIANGAIHRCDVAIAAWGANKAVSKERVDAIMRLVERRHPAMFCLGTTKAGYPKHPLYIKTGTAPTIYDPSPAPARKE